MFSQGSGGSSPLIRTIVQRHHSLRRGLVSDTFELLIIRYTHLALFLAGAAAIAQQQIGVPVPPLGNGPFVFDTAEQHKIRVSIVAKGLSHPWSLAFLPDGSMLVTERPGRLRIIRDGKLDAKPISGVPAVL